LRYALLTIAVWLTASSVALAAPTSKYAVKHYDWKSMSITATVRAERSLIIDDWRLVTTKSTPPRVVRFRYAHMKWTQREMKERLRTLARRARIIASAFPPHHALWTCIAGYEGSWGDPNSGGNGHYGGLQMTPGWMGMFSGTANQYSQAQQEWFAERAWKENGYSYSFLYNQWFKYDAADSCY
jgi:hypothetical protein